MLTSWRKKAGSGESLENVLKLPRTRELWYVRSSSHYETEDLKSFKWLKQNVVASPGHFSLGAKLIKKKNIHLSPVKRICVFEHSVMTNFNCASPAIQRGQGSGFLSEGSS